MPNSDNRASTRNMIRRPGVRIVLALLLLAAIKFALRLYVVQEVLVVLLLVAITMMTALVFAVAFVLFQEGIRRTVLWTRTSVVPPAALNHGPVGPQGPIVHPTLPR
jgi:hypothetical protein